MAWLRDNWDKVAGAIAAVFGVGGIATFFSDVWNMFCQYPLQSASLAAASFAAGYALGVYGAGRRAKSGRVSKRRMKRIVGGLPPRLYDALSSIYDAGGAVELDANCECDELVRRRLLCATSESRLSTSRFYSLPPAVVRYFDEQ